ncbi:MAG: hypothetical protein ACJ77E_11895 [Gaiellaceae bacterium]
MSVDAGVFPMRVVGIAKYGGLDSLGGAMFAVFDVGTAQKLRLRRRDEGAAGDLCTRSGRQGRDA